MRDVLLDDVVEDVGHLAGDAGPVQRQAHAARRPCAARLTRPAARPVPPSGRSRSGRQAPSSVALPRRCRSLRMSLFVADSVRPAPHRMSADMPRRRRGLTRNDASRRARGPPAGSPRRQGKRPAPAVGVAAGRAGNACAAQPCASASAAAVPAACPIAKQAPETRAADWPSWVIEAQRPATSRLSTALRGTQHAIGQLVVAARFRDRREAEDHVAGDMLLDRPAIDADGILESGAAEHVVAAQHVAADHAARLADAELRRAGRRCRSFRSPARVAQEFERRATCRRPSISPRVSSSGSMPLIAVPSSRAAG